MFRKRDEIDSTSRYHPPPRGGCRLGFGGLCFRSFTVILLLGKGPHQATLEVAIYQALYFDFDLSTASILSIFYIAFLLSLCLKTEEPAADMVSPPPKR